MSDSENVAAALAGGVAPGGRRTRHRCLRVASGTMERRNDRTDPCMMSRRRDTQSGQPVLTGTRMPIESVRRAYDGGGRARVREYYPHLTEAQIEVALHRRWRYAALRLVDWLDTPVERRRWNVIAGTLLGVLIVEGARQWIR